MIIANQHLLSICIIAHAYLLPAIRCHRPISKAHIQFMLSITTYTIRNKTLYTFFCSSNWYFTKWSSRGFSQYYIFIKLTRLLLEVPIGHWSWGKFTIHTIFIKVAYVVHTERKKVVSIWSVWSSGQKPVCASFIRKVC